MDEQRSLDLDIEELGHGADAYRVARVAVVETHGVTRDGSASTITSDCRTVASLEREVDRLRAELQDALSSASEQLGEARSQVREPRPETPVPAEIPAAPRKPELHLELSVQDVMTREVCTLRPNDSLAEAKREMDARRFRHLVVLAADGDGVAGVLSHRDIFFGPLAWSLGQGEHGYEAALERQMVKEVMHQPVTIDPSASLADAAGLMLERKIGCLPVVDGERLVGMLSEGDFVALFR